MQYADVVFNLKIEKSFTYHIPPEFSSEIVVGQRVLAPFGNRELTGIVVNFNSSVTGIKCKDIIDLLDEKPLISEQMLRLTSWISDYYMSGWGQALQLALPKGLEKKSNVVIEPVNAADIDAAKLSENQKYLLDLIIWEPGKTSSYYKKKYGIGSFDYTVRQLKKKNMINLQKQIRPERIRKKNRKYITLSTGLIHKIAVIRKSDDLLPLLLPLEGKTLSYDDFRTHTQLAPGRIKTMQKHGILEMNETEILRKYDHLYREEIKDVVLNQDQQYVLGEISRAIQTAAFRVFLLHGVTGSGKTQVYLEAIQNVIARHKSAIILIPEISLTPQTVGRFENFFPGMISVFHSKMSLGERYDTWRDIDRREINIVIGPRSALFLPIKNLGIIVVDEEHDGSYKQEEQAPRYHARDTAIYYAKMNQAVVVLGSATPGMESFNNVQLGKYHLLKLTRRIEDLALPKINISEDRASGRKSKDFKIFSPLLTKRIQASLERKEQIILLQNRRGFSSLLQCNSCGYTVKCHNCDIYLTFHKSTNSLRCHYCGYSVEASITCPKCSGSQINYIGAGTQQIEKEIYRLFPTARVLRMDVDTTARKGAHYQILQRFQDGKADILLGTQMIAKGLDFDNVSLVGVISADIGLTLPDFRSAEHVFQLLTQVAGRCGRKRKQGEVVIQTGMKDHYTLQYARYHDFYGFYLREDSFRKNSGYPPYTRLIKIGISASEHKNASRIAREVVTLLRRHQQNFFEIIGPAPSPISRIMNKYRWQILIKINLKKDPSGKRTRNYLRKSLNQQISIRSEKQKIFIDVDPVDMM